MHHCHYLRPIHPFTEHISLLINVLSLVILHFVVLPAQVIHKFLALVLQCPLLLPVASFGCMHFTARRYARAVYAVVVCLSVTSPHCARMAKCRITQTTSYNSKGIVFFDAKDLGKTPTGAPTTGAPNRGWVGSNL